MYVNRSCLQFIFCSAFNKTIVKEVPVKRICSFGLVMKYNFEIIIFELNLFKYIMIQVCKSTFSNYDQFLIYLTSDKRKTILS